MAASKRHVGTGQHLHLVRRQHGGWSATRQFHTGWREDKVYLFIQDDEIWRGVDAINWTEAIGDFSYGRMTDGAPEWVWFNPNSSNPPTPNGANGTAVHLGNQINPTEVSSTLCNQPCLISSLPLLTPPC